MWADVKNPDADCMRLNGVGPNPRLILSSVIPSVRTSFRPSARHSVRKSFGPSVTTSVQAPFIPPVHPSSLCRSVRTFFLSVQLSFILPFFHAINPSVRPLFHPSVLLSARNPIRHLVRLLIEFFCHKSKASGTRHSLFVPVFLAFTRANRCVGVLAYAC